MWEIPATNEERLFELAYLISMGTVVINHYGDHHSDYIAQLILDKWPQKDQKKFYDLIRLQNGYNGLLPWDSALVFLQMMIVSILSLNEA